MDLMPIIRQAWDVDRELVANTTDLNAPTRCTEWDRRALINHMIGDNVLFAALAGGARPDYSQPAPDFVGNDAANAFEQAVKDADVALSEPGALDRPFALPGTDLPGAQAIGLLATDMVVHGLDLAHATGQPAPVLEQLADGMYEHVNGTIPDEWRGPGRPFGPAITVADDVPAHAKLLAYLGRQP